MYFKQILDENCGCSSYFVASRQTGDAAVIDPAIAIDAYDEILAERGFRLRYVIDTHVHADHVSGARKLAAAHGAELCLHESARVTYPFRPLHDGEELELGQLLLRILHTPGHRPELISVLLINTARSPEPSLVMTGDSLLVGDVGRPDFGGGDPVAQFESVGRLLQLPDWVEVFPGHFEGPCGAGMCGRPSTTMGFERLYNPLVRLNRDAFVSTLVSNAPARPLNMTAIEATNRGVADMGWAMPRHSEDAREVDAPELDTRSSDAVVLDVREPAEFRQGHVPGAVNIPQADLASRLAEVPADQPLFVICQSGSRSLKSAKFLRQMGYTSVASVRGGTAAWAQSGGGLEVGEPATA